MKKVLLACVIIFLLAITINPGNLTGITGLFLQVSSTILTIAKSILKEVLSLVVKAL